MNSSHLTLEQIGDLALGLAPATVVSAHLQGCPACELEVAQLGRLAATMQADAPEDAPAYIIAAILRDFDAFQPHPAPRLSWGRKILARLQLDSARLAPSYGFRAGQAANSRQLLFLTGDGTLDLRITPSKAQWVLSGQLLGQLLHGKAVLRSAGSAQESQLSPAAEFAFPPVPKGIYQLRLLAEGVEIEVPDLTIGG